MRCRGRCWHATPSEDGLSLLTGKGDLIDCVVRLETGAVQAVQEGQSRERGRVMLFPTNFEPNYNITDVWLLPGVGPVESGNSRTSRIVRRIAAGDTGFGSKAYGRARVGTTSSSAFVVRTMIGVDCSAGLDRSHPIASQPGTSRSCTSTRTRSGGLSRAATTAAMPLSTASVTNPELSRKARHSCSVAESAPTTSTRRAEDTVSEGVSNLAAPVVSFEQLVAGGRRGRVSSIIVYRSRSSPCPRRERW
jgi:hypothetical protein